MGSDEGPDRGRRARTTEGAPPEGEDLLDELRASPPAVRRQREQLEALLGAVTAVSADLELSEVLARIVRSACALVDARYGALGVLGPDGEHLMEFITHGVSAEERRAIGDPPRGHGILGLLIRDPRPQRLSDISAHPDSYGFPPHHPRMHSFLGVPIRIRDEVFGNLYLADKRGEDQFSDGDQDMLVALASAAGVAIDNARLYERSQQRSQWAQAVGELTQSLLESEDEDTSLPLVVHHACRLTGAELGIVVLRDEAGVRTVRAVHLPQGAAPPGSHTAVVAAALTGEHWAEVLDVGQPLLLLTGFPGAGPSGVTAALPVVGDLWDPGPAAVVPIAAGAGELGHLVVMWGAGKEDLATQSMDGLTGFAQQAALGLIAARSHHDRALVAMLEDRDRIARDMHDHVIQRLFATGLSLQAAERLAVHPVVRARLAEAVDSLDSAIKDIRSTIFELHTTAGPAGGRLSELVESFAASLGHQPSFHVEGDLGSVDDGLLTDVLAVVREGLSNIARHADATSVEVRVHSGKDLVVVVKDNGRGISGTARRSGLDNLYRRAAARQGTFACEPAVPAGTQLTWTVPAGG